MFRNRILLAALLALAILPAVGCRCCPPRPVAYRPVVVAPAPAPCNSCPPPVPPIGP